MSRYTCICDKCGNEYSTDSDTSTCPTCRSIEDDYDRELSKIKEKYSDMEYHQEKAIREKYGIDN